MFLTDGILERNATDVNALELLTETRHLHPREAGGADAGSGEGVWGELRDDATVLCLTGTAAQPENATPARERIGEQRGQLRTWPQPATPAAHVSSSAETA